MYLGRTNQYLEERIRPTKFIFRKKTFVFLREVLCFSGKSCAFQRSVVFLDEVLCVRMKHCASERSLVFLKAVLCF